MYRFNDKDYFRVTGVVSSKECEQVGHNIKNKVSKDLVTNAVTIPGSLMHWKNEKFLCEYKEYAPPSPIRWSKGANKILKSWEEAGEIQERLVMPANQGFEGFLQFWNKHHYEDENGVRISGIDPIMIEKSMFVENFANTGFAVAGTCDLIARVRLKGKIEEDGYFHECKHHRPHDPLCECSIQWVVTLMDWKYSIQKQPSHPEQLAAYHHMGGVTGAFDIVSENGRFPINHENWSCLFKKPNNVVGFTIHKYPQAKYLPAFLLALEIMRDPKPRSLNHRNYTYGLKGRCMFCAYQNNCRDRETSNEDQTVYVLEEDKSEIRYGMDA